MYKLAVLDIDGTLIDDKGQVSKRTRDTIGRVQSNGGIVTICTGRNIRKAMPVVLRAGIDVPFACIDGNILYDPIKKQVVQDLRLSREEINFIIDAAMEEDAFVELCDGDKYYKYAEKEELYQYDVYNKRTLLGRVKSHFGGIRYAGSLEEMRRLVDPIYQIVIGTDPKTRETIKNKILQNNCERIEVRDYLWDKFLFINQKDAMKSKGVEALCRYFGVTAEETVTIGDERNDIDMLEMAGMGVAMGNAVESVKSVADYITLTNNEDGAAAALEKFFL